MLYAQASNTFITSQTYQTWSGDIILGNSAGVALSINNRTEYGLTKTSLISSVSYLNLEGWNLVWGAKLENVLLWRRVRILGPCDSVPPPIEWYGGWLICIGVCFARRIMFPCVILTNLPFECAKSTWMIINTVLGSVVRYNVVCL